MTSGSPAAGNAASGIPEGFSRDPDHWYRRWLSACEQLDGAAGEMSPPDSDPLEDAYQTGIKTERERAASLAESVNARFVAPLPDGGWRHFADLLREDGNEPA